MIRPRTLLFCLFVPFFATQGRAGERELDPRSLPIAQWLSASDNAEIPWNVQVRSPNLRMDQRIEVPYEVRIGAKQLNRSGNSHNLFLITRMSSLDGEWLNEASIVRQEVNQKLPGNVSIQ